MLFCLSLCYLRFDGSSFITAASSNYGHSSSSLGKISAGLVAISGYQANTEVELYASGNWYKQPKFPEENKFFYYSVATYDDQLYVFGEFNFYFDFHFITLFYFYFRWWKPRWKISSYWSNDWFGTWMDQGTRTPYSSRRPSINSHWKSNLPYWWIRKSVRIFQIKPHK